MASSHHGIQRLLVAAVAMLIASVAAQAQKGEATFGAQAGYTSTNNSGTAGLFFQYSFTDFLRIAPEVGCVFRHQNEDAFTVDANFHFPIRLGPNSLQFYPLVGVNYSSWTLHDTVPGNIDDVSTRSSKFGLNMGGGFQIKTSSTLKLKLEAKYLMMSHYSTFAISAGIGYCF